MTTYFDPARATADVFTPDRWRVVGVDQDGSLELEGFDVIDVDVPISFDRTVRVDDDQRLWPPTEKGSRDAASEAYTAQAQGWHYATDAAVELAGIQR